MTIVKYMVEVDIDDELLAEHDGRASGPPNDPEEWFGGDLVTAVEKGLAEIIHEPLEVVR